MKPRVSKNLSIYEKIRNEIKKGGSKKELCANHNVKVNTYDKWDIRTRFEDESNSLPTVIVHKAKRSYTSRKTVQKTNTEKVMLFVGPVEELLKISYRI